MRPSEAHQGQDLSAQLQHLVVVHLVHVGLAGAGNFGNRVQWDGIQPSLHAE